MEARLNVRRRAVVCDLHELNLTLIPVLICQRLRVKAAHSAVLPSAQYQQQSTAMEHAIVIGLTLSPSLCAISICIVSLKGRPSWCTQRMYHASHLHQSTTRRERIATARQLSSA